MFLFALPSFVLASVGDVNQFNKIAVCESQNSEMAKSLVSSASGRFQFIKSTWKQYGLELWGKELYTRNVFNYNDNTELAWYVYETYGTSDWSASQSCWGQT